MIQAYLLRGKWTIPGGDITDVFLAAGHAIRDGISPYYLPGSPTPFFYGPPWAILLAGLSFIPPAAVYVLLVGAEVAALRYMAGSWRRFCYFLWFPVLPFELLGGQTNLILAASIVAAVRGHAWLVVAGGLAKLSPASPQIGGSGGATLSRLPSPSQSPFRGYGSGRRGPALCSPP